MQRPAYDNAISRAAKAHRISGKVSKFWSSETLLPFSALLTALLAEEGYLRSPTNECDAFDAFESFRKMLELVSAAAIYEFLVARKLHPLRREEPSYRMSMLLLPPDETCLPV